MTRISFVIPCYGSEKTISSVVEEIKKTVRMRKGHDYEIILVNDNSPDGVFRVIKAICKKDKKIKAVSLTRNFGQQAALMAGQAQVTGDIVVCLDDDGQSPAGDLYRLLDKLNEGFDVVYAGYGLMKKQSLIKNFGSWVNSKMTEIILSKPRRVQLSSYFMMRRLISDEMIQYKNPYPYNIGLILSITRKVASVNCEDRKRLDGKSGYTFTKLVAIWLDGFTNFSVKPLRIATILGVLCGTFGFAFGIFTVIHKILHPDTPAGYTAIISVISFVEGIILLVLGMIGEYIGRIFISINKIPQYVIDEKINIKAGKDGKKI